MPHFWKPWKLGIATKEMEKRVEKNGVYVLLNWDGPYFHFSSFQQFMSAESYKKSLGLQEGSSKN